MTNIERYKTLNALTSDLYLAACDEYDKGNVHRAECLGARARALEAVLNELEGEAVEEALRLGLTEW